MEQSLAGCADQIKEHLIGVEVFDRKLDYDPRIDPIVRVEARRLRAKSKAYYTSAGRVDWLVLAFPKGSYVPTFKYRSTVPAETRPAATDKSAGARSTGECSIVVLPFANLTPLAGQALRTSK